MWLCHLIRNQFHSYPGMQVAPGLQVGYALFESLVLCRTQTLYILTRKPSAWKIWRYWSKIFSPASHSYRAPSKTPYQFYCLILNFIKSPFLFVFSILFFLSSIWLHISKWSSTQQNFLLRKFLYSPFYPCNFNQSVWLDWCYIFFINI